MQLSLLSRRIFLFLKQNILPFISFYESHFTKVFQKKITFYYIRNIPAALEGLYFFGLIICFISFPFYSLVWFLSSGKAFITAPEKHVLPFFMFSWNCIPSLHIYFLRVFVLITYLQCNIFICLRYLRRTIFLRHNNIFFRILFVRDIWKEPYYFALIICFSVFHLSQISEKNHTTSPW